MEFGPFVAHSTNCAENYLKNNFLGGNSFYRKVFFMSNISFGGAQCIFEKRVSQWFYTPFSKTLWFHFHKKESLFGIIKNPKMWGLGVWGLILVASSFCCDYLIIGLPSYLLNEAVCFSAMLVGVDLCAASHPWAPRIRHICRAPWLPGPDGDSAEGRGRSRGDEDA